jgi:hypothetical protein
MRRLLEVVLVSRSKRATRRQYFIDNQQSKPVGGGALAGARDPATVGANVQY